VPRMLANVRIPQRIASREHLVLVPRPCGRQSPYLNGLFFAIFLLTLGLASVSDSSCAMGIALSSS